MASESERTLTMRVLHLLDRPTTDRPTVLAMLADAMGRLGDIEQQVVCFGAPRNADLLTSLAVNPVARLRVWPGLSALSVGGLRREVRRRGIDMVHAWSLRALSLATMACPDRPRVLSVTEPLGPRGVHWLRALLEQTPGRTGLLATSNTRCRELLEGGVTASAAVVLRPAVDLSRVHARRREALRAAWGIQSTDATSVCLLLADPPQNAAIQTADLIQTAVAVTAEARASAGGGGGAGGAGGGLVIIGPRGPMRRGPSVPSRTDALAAPPWAVLPGCDVALALGDAGGGLALLWAMAANVPIVGEATYAISEIVEDRHSALLAKPGDGPGLAEKIGQLRDDQRLAWALRDTARHEAYSFFSRQRYCENLARVYRQMIGGDALDVPLPQVTGGMRFTGRG